MTAAPTTSPQPSVPATVRRRRRFTIVGVAALIVLFVVAVVVGQDSTSAPKPPAGVGVATDSALPADVASLPLVDETGHTTNLAAFQGKVVVLSDFMTLCQEICPITTAALNKVDEAVTKAGLGDKVAFLDITVDPGRDDPARLHAYRAFANLLPNWTLLTGKPQNLAALWKYFGVSYSKTPEGNPPGIDWLTKKPLTYDMTHNDALIYLDAVGHERFVISGMALGSDATLTAEEKAFLNDAGRQNLADAASSSWTGPQALQVVSWLTKKRIRPLG
jgi:protein SCO1/2